MVSGSYGLDPLLRCPDSPDTYGSYRMVELAEATEDDKSRVTLEQWILWKAKC